MSTGLHKLWKNIIPAIPDHSLYDSKHPICEPETQNTLCYGIFMDYYERSEKKHKKRAWRRDPGSSAQNCRTSSDCCRPELGNSSNAILRIVSAGTPSRPPPFSKKFAALKILRNLGVLSTVYTKPANFAPKNFAQKG